MSSPSAHATPCPSELDRQALQGTWEQIALEDSGIANPPDEHSAPGALTTIEGNQFRVTTQEGEVLLQGCFTLMPAPHPRASLGSTPSGLTQESAYPPATPWMASASFLSPRMKACPGQPASVRHGGRQCARSCASLEQMRGIRFYDSFFTNPSRLTR